MDTSGGVSDSGIAVEDGDRALRVERLELARPLAEAVALALVDESHHPRTLTPDLVLTRRGGIPPDLGEVVDAVVVGRLGPETMISVGDERLGERRCRDLGVGRAEQAVAATSPR